MDIEPIEVCAPMRLENAAEVRPNSSSAAQYPRSPAPTPPYSSGNGSPKNPSAPISLRIASGILSSSSTCFSRGCRRPSTNSRTVRLRRTSSSGRSKSTGRSLDLGDVDGRDAECHAFVAHASEPCVPQQCRETLGVGERPERSRQIAVRPAVATKHHRHWWKDVIEVEG